MRSLSILTLLAFCVLVHPSFAQTQLGNDLTGLRNLDSFGKGIALDSIGHRVVIGAPQRRYGQYTGQVRVFDFVDTTWVQVGQNLDGVSTFEFFGEAVAMSADGEVIVVRVAQLNNIGGGYVQAYRLVDTAWIQLGTDLTSSLGYFGRQIDLNSDGSRIVIGSNANYVQVFEWDDMLSDWVQLGATLFGSYACNPPEYFGRQVAIDGTGNRIIVGAPNHDLGCSSPSDAGRTVVFDWDGISWNQVGQSLFGGTHYNFGLSVDISGNGNRIACGAPSRTGKGRVFTYDYNGGTGMWELYGDTIQGVTLDKLGRAVKLSYDGCTLAVGTPGNSNQPAGVVDRYRLVKSHWTKDGAEVFGAGSNQTGAGNLGTVGMNASGSIVIFGSPSISAGICRVYQYPSTSDTTLIVSSCGPYIFNGVEYNVSGNYSQSINTVNSCDSIVHLDLTVLNIDSSLVKSGDTLTAFQDSLSYQWYDCGIQSDIAGETNQSFIPPGSGTYAVKLSNGVCEVMSECIYLQTVSTQYMDEYVLELFPNPVAEEIYFSKAVSGHLIILSSEGRIIKSTVVNQLNSLRIENLSPGIYLMRILTDRGDFKSKFLVE